ncbi:PglL family O-oligosaccharyltransferase [Vibrio diabolicus]|uniref:PglL family O-oligosaccharyltransferase n=1 Tax=Vibrio diabolicus TaxID=50719 RepID=UPI00232DCDEC|nr:Wzy polymerase domain-containing protein [Vibrio diabolicus]
MIKPNTIILLLVFGFFTVGMNIYTETSLGGQGIIQTYNSITAIEITFLISFIVILCSLNKRIYISPIFKFLLLLAGAILISSLFNTHKQWDVFLSISCVVLLIVGVFIVYQLDVSEVKKLLWILVVGSSIQGLVGILQVHDVKWVTNWTSYLYTNSTYKVPLSIFKQINVFGSFLVSGFALSLLLLVNYSKSKVEYVVLFCLIAIQGYAFYLVKHSRTAMLAVLVAIFLVTVYILYNWFTNNSIIKKVIIKPNKWVPIVLGILPLIIALNVTINKNGDNRELQAQVDHAIYKTQKKIMGTSDPARIAIYLITWNLIEKKIWTGYGYGSFTRAYEYHLADAGVVKKYTGRTELRHPHNIVLYIWAEGGVVPVIALFLLVGAIINVIILSGRIGLLWLAVLTPISLHLLTEAPFSMSVPHILLFGLLLGAATAHTKVSSQYSWQRRLLLSCGLGLIVIAIPFSVMFGVLYNDLLTYTTKLPPNQQRSSTLLIDESIFEGPLTYRFNELRAERAFRVAMRSKRAADYKSYIHYAEPLAQFFPDKRTLENLALSYAMVGDKDSGRKYFNQLVYHYPNRLNWFSLIRYYGEPTIDGM